MDTLVLNLKDAVPHPYKTKTGKIMVLLYKQENARMHT